MYFVAGKADGEVEKVMIGYVHGEVTRLGLESCIVDVQGVGYRVTIPTSTREQIGLGDDVRLFTHLQVRDDGWTLYGFYTEEEYELFALLITVAGVGPKVACGMVSAISPEGFYAAVRNQNRAVLTTLPGVGKKTAERLLLELKDKVPQLATAGEEVVEVPVLPEEEGLAAETIRALVGLGYTEHEVRPTVLRLAAQYTATGPLLRAALVALGKEKR